MSQRSRVDDVLALFLLLASPGIHIEAITVVFGNTTLPKACQNVFKVYQLIKHHIDLHPEDAQRFPNWGNRPAFAKGAEGPLEGTMNLAEYFHGPDGLSDISTTHPEYNIKDLKQWLPAEPDTTETPNAFLRISSLPAHQVILDVLEQEPPDTVTILSAGPLTNISKAYTASPTIFRRIHRLVSMGGALDVPGNTSPSAEFNFFADPYAAHHILSIAESGLIPFVLVPLDATSRHVIPFSRLLRTISASACTPIEGFLSALLSRPREVLKMLGLSDEFEMHDPFAAWFVIQTLGLPVPGTLAERSGWGIVKRKFIVEKIGEYTKGMCVVDRRGSKDEVGVTRAIDGIVIAPSELHQDQATSDSDTPHPHHEGVNVLLRWPKSSIFIEEMMKRVFWYSS
ncbi:hypothetical protein FRC03_007798 [Tulasnella sp. 419]|nr:hypothetical protein FRC02_006297 [Tulasnella sp. 418]KAG8968339.1 hypothetical protein FRC03_007798 [Tulasnella sp. 419]